MSKQRPFLRLLGVASDEINVHRVGVGASGKAVLCGKNRLDPIRTALRFPLRDINRDGLGWILRILDKRAVDFQLHLEGVVRVVAGVIPAVECILRSVTVGSAEQNGRDAERAVAYLTA